MTTKPARITTQQSTKCITDNLDKRIEHLVSSDRNELIECWETSFGRLPYKGIRNPTIVRALAYQEQVKLMGGLKPTTSNKLIKLAKAELSQKKDDSTQMEKPHLTKLQSDSGKWTHQPKPQTQLGCRLVREWNGRTYEVVVADKGFILNGITHRSLSACAKAITGAHWSGPRFFGVEA